MTSPAPLEPPKAQDLDPVVFGGPLPNPRNEMYCQKRALDGITSQQAYAQVFDVPLSRRTTKMAALQLDGRADVRDRIGHLQTALAMSRTATTLTTKFWATEHLRTIVEKSQGTLRVVRRGSQDLQVIHKNDLTDEDEMVGLFENDPGAAIRAIDTLSKMEGWYEAKMKEPMGNQSLEALAENLAAKQEEVKKMLADREKMGKATTG
jgi:hypothetical protein